MTMTEQQTEDDECATCCHICKKPGFSKTGKNKKVRNHDHRTGRFRGAAHNKCKINYFSNRFLPKVFHNLKGYDSHMIIKKAYEINNQLGNKNIDVIPNSYEKFMSFSIGDLKFIDSLQFMASSLEKLVENLYDPTDKFKHFKFMKKEFPEHYEMLSRKGVYPYEWIDDIDKMNYEGFPPIEAFRSSLKGGATVSEEEYNWGKHVY